MLRRVWEGIGKRGGQKAESSPAHVRPVEALGRVVLRGPVLAAHGAARLLRGRDLGLQRRGVRIDPLQLGEVAVEDADDLAQLERGQGIG